MFDVLGTTALPAFVELFQIQHLLHLLFGVVLGLSVGLLPGLGGLTAMALVLPFIYGMDQTSALAMIIGMTSVTNTSDTFPSVLMGIPGSSSSQATVVDGYPLARKGQGARALSAAFMASMVGGVFGAFVLTFAVFFAKPILLMIGFGEQLLLVILALILVGMLTGPSVIKGLAGCGFGILVGCVGAATATAEYRMTYGSLYLSDGIPLVVLALGLFAIPEILEVLRTRERIAEEQLLGKGWLQGLKDTWIHKWIVLRCSAIGTIIGALPGIGGSVIDWVAYGHVVQTSKDKSQFGKGDIRGVIAPESANNAKEGGALIPTLLFGIPGSGTMALVLAAFTLIGITPGRQMVQENLSLTFTIIWSIAVANIFGAGIAFALASPISRLTAVRYRLLAPFLLSVVFFAAYQATQSWGDLLTMMAVGGIAIFLKRFGWSRPAFLIGFVLSSGLEAAFYRTAQIYGFSFLYRPVSIVLFLLVAVTGYMAWRSKTRVSDQVGDMEGKTPRRLPQVAFATVLLLVPLAVILDTWDLRFLGRVFPLTVAVITLMFISVGIYRLARAPDGASILFDGDLGLDTSGSDLTLWHGAGIIAGFAGLIAVLGFAVGSPVFVGLFLLGVARVRWPWAIFGAAAMAAFLYLLTSVLNVALVAPLIDWGF
ncbi:hypothetical protein EF888_14720 [Silicimonas algicola]|nr:tripartite tricarboxylate transporter permease [Silicimonas algicola]AZQ69733.1 hypothetical protein EF888_14720 [Silicimonas algicola]